MPTEADFLRVAFQHRQGALHLDIAFTLSQPWTVLFGASGSGKTTILRAISGLLHPDQGTITHHGQPQLDAHTFIPPHRRAIRSAAQSARLFPTLTIEQNLAYGITTPEAATPLIPTLLELFRITPHAASLPHHLSGGEQQRASVARAVASAITTPHALLLLDEPFAGLDLALRDTLALALKAFLREHDTPVLSVTHDVAEAFLLGAEVLRLHQSRITEQGPVHQILAPERQRILIQLSR